ncbi:MAG: hypothetical protein ACLQUY_20575 [Ktedonobacterales bacterium]
MINTRPPASAAEAGSGQETPAQQNEQGEREQEQCQLDREENDE